MNLPIQSKPVLRTLSAVSDPAGRFDAAGVAAMQFQHGVSPSGCGVEPSFGWNDVLDIATKVAPIVLAAL
jgi:hypothetical protein